jgi:hypothetical protein
MSFDIELAREYVVHRISVKHRPVVRTLGDAINYLHSYCAGARGGSYQELDRLLYEAVRTGGRRIGSHRGVRALLGVSHISTPRSTHDGVH